MASEEKKHIWNFYRYGGIDQVELSTAEDLTKLNELDPKLWAAMTCPVSNVDYDQQTLTYLDTDGDKRIKIPEIIAGVNWISSILKDPASIKKPEEDLPLDKINENSEEGKALLSTAKQVLFNLGKEDAKSISLDDLASTQKIFAATAFNGDGIITPDTHDGDKEIMDAECSKVISDVIGCMGGDTDRSGKLGISQARLDDFLSQAAAYSEWAKKPDKDSSILTSGADTAALDGIMNAVRAKIDDYFTRCRLASFDEKYAKVGQELDNDYIALLKKSLTVDTPELKELPLAMVSTEAVLDLTKHINPFWTDEIAAFAEKVVKPITGKADKLSEADWGKIKAHFAAYEAWQAAKPGKAVESLGVERLDAILSSNKKDEITALIARDKALEPEFNRLNNVDKMIRYYKFLFKLLNNFVAFKDFYNKEKRAIFQAGTLYIDSRSCTLCIKVDDVAAHSARAVAANTFLLYCECTRKHTGEKMNVAVAVTDGESDQLIVGRNGIFVDTKGNYWDAVITKVVDHPISIRQAFWSPYKKLGALINEQVEKYASSKDKAVTENFTAKVGEASTKLQAPAAAPAAGAAPAAAPAQSSFNAAQYAGIFAAVGLALATIGSAISSVVSGFMALSWWQMPLAIIGILLLISGPSMIITAMKLHKRNLGSILDANGWAINTRARINITMGRYLTSVAKLPENSKRNFDDPFKEEKNHWRMWLSIILVILILLFCFLPGFADSRHMVKAFFVGESTCEEPAKKDDTKKAEAPAAPAEKAPAAPAEEKK